MKLSFLMVIFNLFFYYLHAGDSVYIRINQLGYLPGSSKVAVAGIKGEKQVDSFELVNVATSEAVLKKTAGKNYGAYGPFANTYRLDFSEYRTTGIYFIRIGNVQSPQFKITDTAYKGTADFALKYMRQQRSKYNPFLKDSCHTKDGYIVYGTDEGKYVDVSGGWHDASDYLQYSTTSANATYHLLAAYRDFPSAFTDKHLANGHDGRNNIADVLDEAKWGLDWLLKMHPAPDVLFNQIADDRDHAGYRLPNKDSVDYGYGKANGRPVYFITGEPQGLGKYKNRATGIASTAGKFASAFALAANIFKDSLFSTKAVSAYRLGLHKPGVAQTAPNRAPYFYEEDNWADDMELAAASLYSQSKDKKILQHALEYAQQELITPWLGADTARHYQWYPFHNFGHYELARNGSPQIKKQMTAYYKAGIDKVWNKAKNNAFYRGVPFIWCSNNLTVSFAIQCILYRKLSGDTSYIQLEQACVDWLFGCNPWGTSMVCGLPADGDFPVSPHSSLAEMYKFPLDGALVDGPVYGNIYKSLIGITLNEPDEYEAFQSGLVVYHDDGGDYSTNEPTMDGTASLVYLLAAMDQPTQQKDNYGAITRGNTAKKQMAIIFTGDEFLDGLQPVLKTLKQNNIQASFFLTGNAFKNTKAKTTINEIKRNGHYLGAHSDQHLLYADWNKRDSSLITKKQFVRDLENNYNRLKQYGITKQDAPYFLPPYEWYNNDISAWTQEAGLQLVNFTPGTRSAADYTYPAMGSKYVSSKDILHSITVCEENDPNGLNGFILLVHAGADPRRTDKFYNQLPALIKFLKNEGYEPVRIDKLLSD